MTPRAKIICATAFGVALAAAGVTIVIDAAKNRPPPADKSEPAARPDPEMTEVADTQTQKGSAPKTPPVGVSVENEEEPKPAYVRPDAKLQYYAALPAEQQPRMIHWFGGVPQSIYSNAVNPGAVSNIRLEDYVGPESCAECHSKNYERWSKHAHRFMNNWAKPENVRGDFSGDYVMDYLGGKATFFKDGESFRMSLERDGTKRTFDITRTIGSRFFQYYVGKMVEGPEAEDHELRTIDHVMPLGYWFEPEEWVPIVNVGDEMPDGLRDDPFVVPSTIKYDVSCSACHTTRPTGDLLANAGMMNRLDAYAPRVMHFETEKYIAEEHPEIVAHLAGKQELSGEDMVGVLKDMHELPVEGNVVGLGVSCEGCHNGAAAHARDEKLLPSFFPRSEHLIMGGLDKDEIWGRNAINANWTCSRCHAGGRKRYANGISTWNSTELSDAARGSCYDPVKAQARGMDHLTCVHCHEPHTSIGQKWDRTQAQDNASCISCHDQFSSQPALEAHTHHPAASAGSACMNCHMPRINEGLQDMVRTHTIFSPTDPAMLKSNQPNACNLCHVDKPVGWTVEHLHKWYGASEIPPADLAASYPDQQKAAVLNWLENEHHGTRLVATDSLTRQNADWALAEIVDSLDDPYLINRQFGARGLEKMTGVDARDHGYRFYMTPEERKAPLQRLRKALLDK